MKNNTIVFPKIFLFILLFVFGLGVFLILKPENKGISYFEKENILVGIINLKEKSTLKVNKMVGAVLILSAIFGYFLMHKLPSLKNKREKLTQQETKVYNLLTKAYSNKEIASELNVSVSTIKTHINNIYKKKGISSRTELSKNQ